MKKTFQLLLPVELSDDRKPIRLSLEIEDELLDAVASLLLQVLLEEESKVGHERR